MPIELDKILSDIAAEKVLHPSYQGASKKEVDDAWTRVGKNNKLSVHEARSIFKVLQKKYEQEKTKKTPSWKLFNIMEEIHKKIEVKLDIKTDDNEMPDDDEEYEMLEVQEEEDQPTQTGSRSLQTSGSTSDGDSPGKPMKMNSSRHSPEKEEKPIIKVITHRNTPKQVGSVTVSNSSNAVNSMKEEKKLLNTMASPSPRVPPPTTGTPNQTSSAATAAALYRKGITMKKTTSSTPSTSVNSASGNGTSKSQSVVSSHTSQQKHSSSTSATSSSRTNNTHILEVGETIKLPESIKRKLSEDQNSTQSQNKKINVGQTSIATTKTTSSQGQVQHTTTAQLMQVKHERQDEDMNSSEVLTSSHHGINLITIPGNPTLTNGLGVGGNSIVGGGGGGASSSTAATVASTSTNGLSPRTDDAYFRNDIIFDAATNCVNGDVTHKSNTNATPEIINLGNFDNSLPPTFFKNLCNSSRYEALGLYVANVMNRLQGRSAAKLELAILRAIIDVQSDELEQ